MMNETAAPVVTNKDRSNELIVADGDKAHSGIALKELLDTAPRVGIAEANTFSRFPKAACDVVVVCLKHAHRNGHRLQRAKRLKSPACAALSRSVPCTAGLGVLP